jgi:L-amino acid N-acyltransferase YncA
MKRIFVSHASQDAALVDEFVDTLIVEGCGLRRDDVFYSSRAEMGIESGVELMARLRTVVAQARLVIAVVTPAYPTLPVCAAELGAAWGRENPEEFFPIMVPGMSRAELRGTVLEGMMIEPLDNSVALDELHDRVCEVTDTAGSARTWSRAKDKWLTTIGDRPNARLRSTDISVTTDFEQASSSAGGLLAPDWSDAPRTRAMAAFKELAPKCGLTATLEVRAAVTPPLTCSTAELHSGLHSAVVRAFKWPAGLIRDTGDQAPRVMRDGFETLISLEPSDLTGASFDYWRALVDGRFYSLASLYEDEYGDVPPQTLLWDMRTNRTAEAILHIARLYRALGAPDDAEVEVILRYAGLRGRTIRGLSNYPVISGRYTCTEDTIEASVATTIRHLEDAFGEHVKGIVRPLFALFDLFTVDDEVLDGLIEGIAAGALRWATPQPIVPPPVGQVPDAVKPRVRAATHADASELAALKREQEDAAYRALGTAEEHAVGLETYCSPSYISGLVDSPHTIVLVAELRATIQGMVALELRESDAFLQALYVRDKRRGIGSLLVGASAAVAGQAGRELMCCEIFDANTGARQAFARLGFAATGAHRESETYRGQQLLEFVATTRAVLARTNAAPVQLASEIMAFADRAPE